MRYKVGIINVVVSKNWRKLVCSFFIHDKIIVLVVRVFIGTLWYIHLNILVSILKKESEFSESFHHKYLTTINVFWWHILLLSYFSVSHFSSCELTKVACPIFCVVDFSVINKELDGANSCIDRPEIVECIIDTCVPFLIFFFTIDVISAAIKTSRHVAFHRLEISIHCITNIFLFYDISVDSNRKRNDLSCVSKKPEVIEHFSTASWNYTVGFEIDSSVRRSRNVCIDKCCKVIPVRNHFIFPYKKVINRRALLQIDRLVDIKPKRLSNVWNIDTIAHRSVTLISVGTDYSWSTGWKINKLRDMLFYKSCKTSFESWTIIIPIIIISVGDLDVSSFCRENRECDTADNRNSISKSYYRKFWGNIIKDITIFTFVRSARYNHITTNICRWWSKGSYIYFIRCRSIKSLSTIYLPWWRKCHSIKSRWIVRIIRKGKCRECIVLTIWNPVPTTRIINSLRVF